MAGRAGSTTRIVHVDMTLTQSKVKVRDVKLGFFLQPKLDCSKPNINRSSKSSG